MEQRRTKGSLCRVLPDNHAWRQKAVQGKAICWEWGGNSGCPSEINNSVTSVESLIGTTAVAEISPAHALCFWASVPHSSTFPRGASCPMNWTWVAVFGVRSSAGRYSCCGAADRPCQHFCSPAGFAASGSRSPDGKSAEAGPVGGCTRAKCQLRFWDETFRRT